MDHTKRKLQSDSIPSNGGYQHGNSETLASTTASLMPRSKRMKSESDGCSSFDNNDVSNEVNDSSPRSDISEDTSSVNIDSIGFNPVSKVAQGQWRVAKSPFALENPSSTEDDEEDAADEPSTLGMALDDLPKLDNDDDSDVNLVMDLLM